MYNFYNFCFRNKIYFVEITKTSRIADKITNYRGTKEKKKKTNKKLMEFQVHYNQISFW